MAELRRQLDWFRRQLFGRTSEKRLEFDDAGQTIPESEREVVGEKVTHRLAQEPGAYKVLKYVRKVVRRRDTGELAPPSPPNMLDRTCVDAGFLAGMLVDKFRYHLPLYRQHRRLADSGIRAGRSSLTNWAGRAVDLLAPVVEAQAAHIRRGDVIAMDETAIKAGRVAPGKMRKAYFWPVCGESDEIVFHYTPSRARKWVDAFLGDYRGTLLSDGYAAYAAYAKRRGLVHAQCWSHCRRKFAEAEESNPAGVSEALSLIGALSCGSRRCGLVLLQGQHTPGHITEKYIF